MMAHRGAPFLKAQAFKLEPTATAFSCMVLERVFTRHPSMLAPG